LKLVYPLRFGLAGALWLAMRLEKFVYPDVSWLFPGVPLDFVDSV